MQTKQQVFDRVVAHLRAQGICAMTDGVAMQCRYRGPNNTKCAVGALIPDDDYDIGMEGKNLSALLASYQYGDALRRILPEAEEYYEMLANLQGIHDSSMPTLNEELNRNDGRSMERVEHKLQLLANAAGVTYTAP